MMPEAEARLIAAFRKLPAVGLKTAERYAYAVLKMSRDEAESIAVAITEAKDKIKTCPLCGDYTESDVCERCMTADKSVICVVGEPKDIHAIEKLGTYNGMYHALNGLLDNRKFIASENIRIKELLARLDGVKEVILATNPDIGGEMTANYIAGLIKPMGIKVTRLAHGIPMGSEIEYADEMTLGKALSDRKEM